MTNQKELERLATNLLRKSGYTENGNKSKAKGSKKKRKLARINNNV